MVKKFIKNESNHDRFKRLATQRTNAVFQKLKVLSNCSNRSVYSYSEEEVSKIFSEVEKKVKEAKSKFHFSKSQEKFSL